MKPESVLCYARHGWAWFTTQPLEDQWGDDWNDAPWEYNAGEPYRFLEDHDDPPAWEIVKVAWEGPYDLPGEHELNSRWSVQDINSGAIAWLVPSRWGAENARPIPAGTTLGEFRRRVEEAGGTVYTASEVRGGE